MREQKVLQFKTTLCPLVGTYLSYFNILTFTLMGVGAIILEIFPLNAKNLWFS